MDYPDVFIHPKAHVGETCKIGAGTKIWQFASVIRGTVLGEKCVIWPHVMLDGSVYGDNVHIASHFAAGPGFKVGNNVFIGPNVTLCNDMWPMVGRDGYDETWLRSGKSFTIEIGDGASIGAGAVILPGVRIGANSQIGAGAIVHGDVPAGALWMRNGRVEPTFIRGRRMRRIGEHDERRARRLAEEKS